LSSKLDRKGVKNSAIEKRLKMKISIRKAIATRMIVDSIELLKFRRFVLSPLSRVWTRQTTIKGINNTAKYIRFTCEVLISFGVIVLDRALRRLVLQPRAIGRPKDAMKLEEWSLVGT
jgi:hypothetical protein